MFHELRPTGSGTRPRAGRRPRRCRRGVARRTDLGSAERLVAPASRMEAAAGRDVPRRRRLADQDELVGGSARLRHGDHRDQGLRVRMLGVRDDLGRRADLHDAAEIHHRDAVGHDPREREVVRDEQARDLTLLAQVQHQAQDAGAERHVEHRRRLVGHDDVRIQHHRGRDRHALPLAARQVVRMALRDVGRRVQSGIAQGAQHHAPALRRVRGPAVDRQRFGDQIEHRLPRVERFVRVLEDHLDAGADRTHRPIRQRGDVLAAEHDRPPRRRDQPHHGVRDRRLAASGFADQRQDLAARQVERHAVHGEHGLHVLLARRVRHVQVVDVQDRRVRHGSSPTRWHAAT